MAVSQIRWGFTIGLTIFALRLAVGWHFFTAGVEKWKDPGFRSSHFLNQSVGPLALWYQSWVPDSLGQERLDLHARRDSWVARKDELVARVGREKAKTKRAEKQLKNHLKKLDQFAAAHQGAIAEHLREVQRLQRAAADPSMQGVDFGIQWLASQRRKLVAQADAWGADLAELEADCNRDLIAAVEIDPATVELPDDPSQKSTVDHAVTWLTLSVGILLMIGLMTPIAAMVGASFLLAVMLSQPFWVRGADLTFLHYQLVELAALFCLAATRAGRWGGIDFFWSGFAGRSKE